MPRERMVTRTVEGSRVTLLALNIETAEPQNVTYDIPLRFKTAEAILNYCKKNFNTGELKMVHVVNVEAFETLYGMREVDFIAKAEILPPRVSKNVEA